MPRERLVMESAYGGHEEIAGSSVCGPLCPLWFVLIHPDLDYFRPAESKVSRQIYVI